MAGRSPKYDSHRFDGQLEDVAFLMSPAGGALTLEQACARVGVTQSFVEMRQRRADDG